MLVSMRFACLAESSLRPGVRAAGDALAAAAAADLVGFLFLGPRASPGPTSSNVREKAATSTTRRPANVSSRLLQVKNLYLSKMLILSYWKCQTLFLAYWKRHVKRYLQGTGDVIINHVSIWHIDRENTHSYEVIP